MKLRRSALELLMGTVMVLFVLAFPRLVDQLDEIGE